LTNLNFILLFWQLRYNHVLGSITLTTMLRRCQLKSTIPTTQYENMVKSNLLFLGLGYSEIRFPSHIF